MKIRIAQSILKRRSRKSKLLVAASSLALVLSFPAVTAMAHNYYGSGYYGECLYSASSSSCDISISNNSFTLNLPIQPTPAGSCTIQSDVVSVSTYDPSGFTLGMGDNSSNTGLLNGSNTVPASGATITSPATLSNDWGYRVDGFAFFGSGPTTPVTSGSLSSLTFAPVEPSGTQDNIDTTSSVANPYLPVSTTVWYGVCLNTSLAVPQGAYSSTILYTATAN